MDHAFFGQFTLDRSEFGLRKTGRIDVFFKSISQRGSRSERRKTASGLGGENGEDIQATCMFCIRGTHPNLFNGTTRLTIGDQKTQKPWRNGRKHEKLPVHSAQTVSSTLLTDHKFGQRLLSMAGGSIGWYHDFVACEKGLCSADVHLLQTDSGAYHQIRATEQGSHPV